MYVIAETGSIAKLFGASSVVMADIGFSRLKDGMLGILGTLDMLGILGMLGMLGILGILGMLGMLGTLKLREENAERNRSKRDDVSLPSSDFSLIKVARIPPRLPFRRLRRTNRKISAAKTATMTAATGPAITPTLFDFCAPNALCANASPVPVGARADSYGIVAVTSSPMALEETTTTLSALAIDDCVGTIATTEPFSSVVVIAPASFAGAIVAIGVTTEPLANVTGA